MSIPSKFSTGQASSSVWKRPAASFQACILRGWNVATGNVFFLNIDSNGVVEVNASKLECMFKKFT